MVDTFISETQDIAKRAWNDLEPKIATALLSGAVSDVVLNVLRAYHINPPVEFAQIIPLGCALLAGYIQHSRQKTVTKTVHLDSQTTLEKITTGPIKTITPSPGVATSWIADAVKRTTDHAAPAPDPVLSPVPDNATVAMPSPDEQATTVAPTFGSVPLYAGRQ